MVHCHVLVESGMTRDCSESSNLSSCSGSDAEWAAALAEAERVVQVSVGLGQRRVARMQDRDGLILPAQRAVRVSPPDYALALKAHGGRSPDTWTWGEMRALRDILHEHFGDASPPSSSTDPWWESVPRLLAERVRAARALWDFDMREAVRRAGRSMKYTMRSANACRMRPYNARAWAQLLAEVEMHEEE